MDEIAPENHCKQKQMTSTRKPPLNKPKNSNHNNSNRGLTVISRPLHLHRHHHHQQQQAEEVKLAALAISFNVRLRSSDMPSAMQERAIRHARALLDSTVHHRPNPTLLARSLKKEFDSVYGPAWHCVAGKSFGSFVTHSPGGFVYFSVDSLSFLLFKTEVHVIAQPSPKP